MHLLTFFVKLELKSHKRKASKSIVQGIGIRCNSLDPFTNFFTFLLLLIFYIEKLRFKVTFYDFKSQPPLSIALIIGHVNECRTVLVKNLFQESFYITFMGNKKKLSKH